MSGANPPKNWEADKDVQDWKVLATEKQKIYYELFKNRSWENYDEADIPYLKAKIGYALFGPPIVEQEPNLKEFYNFYSNYQKERIDLIFRAIRKIIKNSTNMVIGFIFLIAIINKKYTEFPVLRVLKNTSEEFEIIDSYGYSYKNWDKFITANMFPNGFYCYPKTSFYKCNESGEIDVSFRWFVCPLTYSILFAISGPNQGKGPLPVYPVVCISEVKGITEETKELSVPIKPAHGSVDFYAIHNTYSIAESSQRIKNVPKIVAEALEFGFIKFNWYSVLKNIENSMQNVKLITNCLIIEVLASVLFFCNTVLTLEITQQILEEIRIEKPYRKFVFLNSMQKISLKKSLNITVPKTEPLTMNLQFIDNRHAIFNTIIEKHFKDQSMILDEFGNNYMLEKLLEVFASSNETKRYTEIIRDYCLVVEETFKKCEDCRQIFENNKQFKETLKVKNDIAKEKENTSDSGQLQYDSFIQENATVNEIEQSSKTHDESLSTSTFENATFSTPIKTNTSSHSISNPISEKDIADESDQWLLQKACKAPTHRNVKQDKNSLSLNSDENLNNEEFFTPRKNHNEIKIYNDTKVLTQQSKLYSNDNNNTSDSEKLNTNITDDEILIDTTCTYRNRSLVELSSSNYEEVIGFLTPNKVSFSTSNPSIDKDMTEEWLLQNVFNTKHQLTPRNLEQDQNLEKSKLFDSYNNKKLLLTELKSHFNDIKIQNDTRIKVFPQQMKYDNNNINTPETKKHNKKFINESKNVCEHEICEVFIENIEVPIENIYGSSNSFQENYATQVKKYENKEGFKDKSQNEALGTDSLIDDSGLNVSSTFNHENNSLSGKVITIVRQITEQFEPLDYFHAFIHEKLKDCKPIILNNPNDTDSWQFAIEEEMFEVKLVKIEITVRDDDKEWVEVSYY